MNLELIPKYIINLPERVDRLRQVESELKWLFFDTSHNLVNGIKTHPSREGIAISHLACIQRAKDTLAPYCIIMEDDCVFQAQERTREYVYQALEELPDDWDILLAGVYESKGLHLHNYYWSRTDEFCGLHFYIVKNTVYDKILSYSTADHIDRWMVKRGNLKCYVTNKFFAIQSNGFSDNVNKVVDYSDKLRKFAVL